MVTLAKFIMARYFLVAILDIDDLDISEKESELVNKALSEFNSVEDLEKALDNYIKENDWTGNLGSEGSGDRERGLAIEGCISRADIHANESINEFFLEERIRYLSFPDSLIASIISSSNSINPLRLILLSSMLSFKPEALGLDESTERYVILAATGVPFNILLRSDFDPLVNEKI